MLRKWMNRRNEEDGVTMVVALLFVVIMTSLMMAMTALAMMAMQTSIAVRDATYFDIAVNSATSNALNLANNPTKDSLGTVTDAINMHVGEANQAVGVVEGDTGVKWRWYAVPIANSEAGLSYDVIATGYRLDPNDPTSARTVTVRLVSFPTSGARKVDDSIYYRPTKNSVFSWGVFGANSASVSGNTQMTSFNSGDGTSGTSVALGSNENINVSPTATVPNIAVMNSFPGHTTGERCTGTPCKPPITTEYTYGVDTSVIEEWVQEACPLAATSYPSVNVNSGFIPLTAGSKITCLNNLTIGSGDINVDISRQASTGNPEYIYVKGNVNVAPGARFNTTGNSSVSGAMVYRIYAAGNVNIATTGVGPRYTDFRALVAAGGTCSVGAATAATNTWGAFVCDDFSVVGVTSIKWDEQTAQVTGDASETRRIWSIVDYSNE